MSNISRKDYLELLNRQPSKVKIKQKQGKTSIMGGVNAELGSPTQIGLKSNPRAFSKSKYRNIRTVVDGISFMSKKEAQRYCELKIALASGVIVDLELQPVFELQESFIDKDNKKIRSIIYRADFRFIETETNLTIIEDTKGYFTEIFKIKEKLFKKKYPKLILRIL